MKIHSAILRPMLDYITGQHDLIKLTYKINHNRNLVNTFILKTIFLWHKEFPCIISIIISYPLFHFSASGIHMLNTRPHTSCIYHIYFLHSISIPVFFCSILWNISNLVSLFINTFIHFKVNMDIPNRQKLISKASRFLSFLLSVPSF